MRLRVFAGRTREEVARVLDVFSPDPDDILAFIDVEDSTIGQFLGLDEGAAVRFFGDVSLDLSCTGDDTYGYFWRRSMNNGALLRKAKQVNFRRHT